MELGEWITIATTIATVGQIAAVTISRSQSRLNKFHQEQIEELKERAARWEERHKNCVRDLNSLRDWAMWAQRNMMPRTNQRPPTLPPDRREDDENN